jgi:hypothetical protein
MLYKSAEDRLNPIAPPEADESTLGGYLAVHGRAPGFDGSDGCPYTVAIETDPDERGQVAGYLVFLRWASAGTAIMGHLETGDLVFADSAEEAHDVLSGLTLVKVKQILEETIKRKREEEGEVKWSEG